MGTWSQDICILWIRQETFFLFVFSLLALVPLYKNVSSLPLFLSCCPGLEKSAEWERDGKGNGPIYAEHMRIFLLLVNVWFKGSERRRRIRRRQNHNSLVFCC